MNAPSHGTKPLLDPKELLPVAIGVAVGVGLIVGFFVLTKVLGMPTIVEYWDLPRQ